LRKLPPELIAQAQDQTATTINRIMLTFVTVAVFCLLSLRTPDVALLTGGEKLNVPFAGPVSFQEHRGSREICRSSAGSERPGAIA
jgi:hypothetical protein